MTDNAEYPENAAFYAKPNSHNPRYIAILWRRKASVLSECNEQTFTKLVIPS
jgi:hypothetical protein